MQVGTCVYSGQAGNEFLLSAVRSGQVTVVRQMYEIDRAAEAFAGLSKLIIASKEAPAPIDIHVCLWTANSAVAPKTINVSDVTSVGLFNEVDLRYGWSDYPRTFSNMFYGADGRPVTNLPNGWYPKLWDPFSGSARWTLGLNEWVHRHAIASESSMPSYNSSGITRPDWINKSTIFTSYIDLHIYGATTPEAVAANVEKQLKAWDTQTATFAIPFFIGELGPHSTHEIVWEPQQVSDWIMAVDDHLSFIWGDRYNGSCWHGPNHLQFLSLLPSYQPNLARTLLDVVPDEYETSYCPGCGYTSKLKRPKVIRRHKKATCKNCKREWRDS